MRGIALQMKAEENKTFSGAITVSWMAAGRPLSRRLVKSFIISKDDALRRWLYEYGNAMVAWARK